MSNADLRLQNAQAQNANSGIISRLLFALMDWLELTRQKRQLRGFPEEILKDMGLNRCDIERISTQAADKKLLGH